jgi:hypothetical protein
MNESVRWSMLLMGSCAVFSACVADRSVLDEPAEAGASGASNSASQGGSARNSGGSENGVAGGSVTQAGGNAPLVGKAGAPGNLPIAGSPAEPAGGAGGEDAGGAGGAAAGPCCAEGEDGAGMACCGEECVDTQADSDNCGRCGHSCWGGQCSDGVCEPALVATGPTPGRLAVQGDYLYWTAVGGDAGAGAVMRAPKAGGAATAIVPGQEAAFGIALDAGHVYWTSKYDGGTLRRAGLGGAGAETLSAAEAASPLVVSSTHVFGMNPGVWRVPVAGGTLTPQANGATQGFEALTASHVYWTTSSTLYRFPVAGGASEPVASNQSNAYGIAVDATALVWSNLTNYGNNIMIAAPDGSSPVPLASERPGPQTVALDADNVYWTENGIVGGDPSAVVTVPRAGGQPKPIKSWSRGSEGIASSVVTDNQGIYWVVDGSAIGKPGQVWKLAKP